MEIKNIWFLPLKVYSDEVLRVSYLKILTRDKFETIKLPTSLENYKFSYNLTPQNLLFGELIKTRKNWILKNILETKNLVELENFEAYLKLSEMVKIILKYFQDDLEADILDNTISMLSENKHFDTTNFEEFLEKKMGFK